MITYTVGETTFHSDKITGDVLIAWGFKPGKYFGKALEIANNMRNEGRDTADIIEVVHTLVPVLPPEILMRTNNVPYTIFLDAETDAERDNVFKVNEHMDALMRVPTIISGAVMPDACPAGTQMGTIPVGGVVACEDAIHPGFHSADICCSMAISIFNRKDDPKTVLDAIQKVTHFGPGGRARSAGIWKALPKDFDNAFENPFLKGLESYSIEHFGTQGDGNHFAYLGHIRSTGQLALITHHGSRGFGAQLYKRGMAVAKKHTAIHAPRVPEHNAWIKASSEDGQNYWNALQWIRTWTKANHFAIHDLVAKKIGNKVVDRFWNEHNFVFQKADGLFYHGKGATPNWAGYSDDDSGLTLIPMNMAEPILITSHVDNADALGFAPHGAGRNMSRTQFEKENQPVMPEGIDVRFFCGIPDPSELPGAYKNAESVRNQIDKYKLANVSDVIDPYGSIMAGNWENNMPWKKKKK